MGEQVAWDAQQRTLLPQHGVGWDGDVFKRGVVELVEAWTRNKNRGVS